MGQSIFPLPPLVSAGSAFGITLIFLLFFPGWRLLVLPTSRGKKRIGVKRTLLLYRACGLRRDTQRISFFRQGPMERDVGQQWCNPLLQGNKSPICLTQDCYCSCKPKLKMTRLAWTIIMVCFGTPAVLLTWSSLPKLKETLGLFIADWDSLICCAKLTWSMELIAY